MIRFSHILSCLFLVSFFPSASSLAQQRPISLSADSISYNNKTHTSEYDQNVSVKIDNSECTGSHMQVKHGKSQTLAALHMSGSPAVFKIHRKSHQSQIHGHADKITLYPKKHQAILTGNASIVNGIEILKGEHIIYHLSHQSTPANHAKPQTTP
jgi:lipopolysaccharide transport protein LptA